MTFAFLVKGDFGKHQLSSLKARPALVSHSRRDRKGHLCTWGREGRGGQMQHHLYLPGEGRPHTLLSPLPDQPLASAPSPSH